jgi:hypothetical protein
MVETNVHTIDDIEQRLSKFERRLLNNGTPTAWDWLGISIVWCNKPLKSGGTLKRGNSYGVIKYFDMVRHSRDPFEDIELTRDEAIKELLKPYSLRQGLAEIETAKECYVCGKIGIGQNGIKSSWGHFSYQPSDNPYRKWLDICDKCTGFIVSRHLENFIK